MELFKTNMGEGEIIEKALDLFVECVKFSVEDNLQDPHITLRMNMMGIIYGATISKHEINSDNVTQCWRQIIEQFATYHLLGQSKRVIDGSRELTEAEIKTLEESESSQK